MHRHPVIAQRIIEAAPALSDVGKLVRSIHERISGDGYPDGLRDEEIPIGARIVAVCDAYDAMTSSRPYRGALEPQHAVEELRRCAGTQFDARVVETFLAVLEAEQRRGGRLTNGVSGRLALHPSPELADT